VIRDWILEQSAALVQNDSGIPLRHFDEAQWKLNFYGVYNGPISLFKGAYQADLKQRYSPSSKPQELPFGLGYQWRPGTANVLLARRAEVITTTTSAPAPPAAELPSPTITPSPAPSPRSANDSYVIVLAEFSSWNVASSQLQQLVAQGEQVFVSQSKARYRLSLGPYHSRTQAEQARAKLKARWTTAQLASLEE
jgi:hypothetical protein